MVDRVTEIKLAENSAQEGKIAASTELIFGLLDHIRKLIVLSIVLGSELSDSENKKEKEK